MLTASSPFCAAWCSEEEVCCVQQTPGLMLPRPWAASGTSVVSYTCFKPAASCVGVTPGLSLTCRSM